MRISSTRPGRRERCAAPARRRSALLVLVALPLVLNGCGGDEARVPAPYFDLTARFGASESATETASIVFGQAESRAAFAYGFSNDEYDRKRERPFVWSSAEESGVRFHLLEARELRLTLECRPLRAPGLPQQIVTLRLNGEEVGTLPLKAGLRSYEIVLPAGPARAGENLLSFVYSQTTASGGDEAAPGDTRRLATAFYRLDFAAARAATEPPLASRDRDLVFLPWGSELRWAFLARPASELRIERLSFRGPPGSRLGVHVQIDGAPPRLVAEVPAGGQLPAVDLALDRAVPAQLTLRALADQPAEAADGVAIQGAAVWSAEPGPEDLSNAPAPPPPRAAGRPDLMIYLVDTLRADRLGAYGYERPISAAFDAFADEAVLFETGIAQSSWTRASVASLFTGVWPDTHGAIGRRDRLAPEASTLAESLQAAGYHTVAFITNPNVEKTFGFDQGFDEFIQIRRDTSSQSVNEYVFTWLEQWSGEAPLFLYVHTVDPHDPYLPKPEFLERFAADSADFAQRIATQPRKNRWDPTPANLHHLNALYDAEVASNIDSFGKLVDHLRAAGRWDDLLTVFVADHGEEFHDHGSWNHGQHLFVETVNVPLAIRFPGQRRGKRVRTPAQQIDVMPTLLDYLGLPVPETVQGVSLASLADPAVAEPRHWAPRIYSHIHLDGPLRMSVVEGNWKMIEQWKGGARELRLLFDRSQDPLEHHDLAGELPIRTAYLASLVAERLASDAGRLRTDEAVLDAEMEERLRALGYLQ